LGAIEVKDEKAWEVEQQPDLELEQIDVKA